MSKLSFYHPNAKGTGSALTLELHPAHDEVDGSIFVKLTPQKTVGKYENGMCILPTFDHDAALCVRLGITELAQILEVLRGYKEKLNDGSGLFHRTKSANVAITFEHRIEPVPCYTLNITRREPDKDPSSISIHVTMPEACVLNETIAQALLYVAFGVPAAK